MTEAAIRATQLTRDFAGVRAVDALTLEVPPGIIFGFLGANGAGKTTTINLLLGLLEPTAGQAQVLGFDTRTQGNAIRERSGALLEFSGLYERLTAEDNLDFYGRVWRLSSAERQARIRELLTHVELYDRRKERVGAWSRGMKQKLAIARVLLHRPALIFLDEPTAGLDPVASAALRDDLEAAGCERRRDGLPQHAQPARGGAALPAGRRHPAGKLLAVGSPDILRQQTGRPEAEIRRWLHARDTGGAARAARHRERRGAERPPDTGAANQQVRMAPIVGGAGGGWRADRGSASRPGQPGRGIPRADGRGPCEGGGAMITDIWTVMLKEWREYLAGASGSGGSGRGRGVVGVLLIIGPISIFLPLQLGRELFTTAAPLIVDSLFLPYLILQTIVADSFAGERERHTLETLLASRLSDRAILFGNLARRWPMAGQSG